jgi:hypothetical protein
MIVAQYQVCGFQYFPSDCCPCFDLSSSRLVVSTVICVDLMICCWLALECSSSKRSHCELSLRRMPPFDGMVSALSCVPPSLCPSPDLLFDCADDSPSLLLNSFRRGGSEHAMIPKPASNTDQRMVWPQLSNATVHSALLLE